MLISHFTEFAGVFMVLSYLLIMTMLSRSAKMLMFLMMLIMKFGFNRDFLEQFILREDLQLIESVSHFHFLTHLHIFCQYVVSFRAMTRQLVVAIPLVDVSSLCNQILYYLKMATMGRQMKSSPLLYTSCYI